MVQLIGRIVDGKYSLVRLLGEGGMGAVYEAEHTRISRRVAIKLMHRDTKNEPDAVGRFLREAESASAIGHPNIIEIYDVGMEQDGTAFIVMELLDGVSLDVILDEKGALPPSRAVAIVLQILSALYAAHKKGIIHRDLKPENVFMAVDARNREEVKLLDFGVAKVQEASGDELRLTKTGTVLGTPSYLSPEQARGRKDIDERIDIWAAGVMLYQMLAGELPFKGESYNEVLANVLIEEPSPLGQLAPGAPDGLVAVVRRAMSKDRDGRYQGVSEMIEALLPFCERAEYEMTPKAFEVLRKSVPPPPALPRIDNETGMPAIPPASPVPGVEEIGAGSQEEDPERGRRREEVTLDEELPPKAAGDTLGDSVKRTLRKVARPSLIRLRQGALAAFGVFRALGATLSELGEIATKRAARIRMLPPRQAALAILVGAGLAAVAIGLVSVRGKEAAGRASPVVSETIELEPVAGENPADRAQAAEQGPETRPAASSGPAAGPAAVPAPSGPAAGPASAEMSAVQPGPAEQPGPEEQASAAQAAADPDLPAGAEPPPEVVVELRGAPAGAVVTLSGMRMETPLRLARSDRPKMLRVTASGYQTFQRIIRPDRDQVITVSMVKAAAAARAPAPAKPEKKKPQQILLSNPFK